MNLENYIDQQILWSEKTFGPGDRTAGLLNHISKELDEIAADPKDVFEWIDVIILALDGAWRSGHTADEVVEALEAKQKINMKRNWPDWRQFTNGEAIEHLKEKE